MGAEEGMVKDEIESGFSCKSPLVKSFLLKLCLAFGCIPLVFLVSCRGNPSKAPQPTAVKGILDLTHWNFTQDGSVNLTGEYEFYWRKLLSPSDFSTAKPPSKPTFVKVPSYWNRYEIRGRNLPGDGYATYRLKILIKSSETPLALKFLSIGTAFTAYLDGRKVSGAGTPGKSLETSVPRYFPHVVDFKPKSNHIEMILQISNYHHRRGGAWEVIELGSEKALREEREKSLGFVLFLFGSIFIIALYHLGLFVLRKTDRSPFYFGIFCLFIAIRLLTTGERYLIHIFPGVEWSLMVRLEYLSFYLSVPAFLLFMQSLFPQEFSKKFLQVIVIVNLALACMVALTKPKIFSYSLPLSHIIMIIAFLYGLKVLITAILRSREGALVFLLGYVVLSLTAINDMLHVEQIIRTGYFAPFGLFIFIFSQAFLLSVRSSRAFATIEVQQLELGNTLQKYRDEIAERKRADKALRLSEEKYRNILENIEDGYYEVDLRGNLIFFNDSLCDILGYTSRQLMGTNYRELAKQETGEAMYRTFNQVYQTGKAAKALGWEMMKEDGTTRYLETSITLMRDSESQPVGFRGIARDITERRQAEEQARLHEKQLMQADKMVALGTLVSGMAHEINNPNNFILLNARVLSEAWENIMPILEKYYEENGDFVLGGMKYSEMRRNILKLFSGIVDGSNRIKHIVDDLKNYLRGDIPDLEEPVDINDVLRSAISLISNMIKNSTNHFSIKYGGNLPELNGNFQQLEQVAVNLLQNACQAIEDRNKGIFVSTAVDEKRSNILVRIHDQGTGIAPEDLQHVTEPFYTTKTDMGGVGLGLSISSKIIEQHGGRMEVTSELRKGTTVEIILPVTRQI